MYAFDTLSYARRLKEAGVPEAQAEAHAEAARTFIMGELVTRHDLAVMGQALQRDLQVTREGLQRDLQATSEGLQRDLQTATTELRQEQGSLRRDLDSLRRELEAKIDHQTLKLTLRLGLLLAAGIAVLAAILRIG